MGTSTRALAGLKGAARRAGQDLRLAGRHQLFSRFAGSPWLPGTLRKLVFTLAGASLNSSPGPAFVFLGSPRNLVVGSGVYFNVRVFVEANGPVRIGDDCALGMEAMILTSHHPLDQEGHWATEAEPRPVVIGDRVWIGARAVLLPGATIESDVVIAAGAVVAGHCRSHGVYAGVPARRIRSYREPDSEE
jgi:maltose O-acetyltransferase